MGKRDTLELNSERRFERSIAKLFSARRPERLVTVAPSILASNFADLTGEMKRMMRARCYWAHLDVMDGHFVPNITIGPPVVASLRQVSKRLFLDAHLMIEEPMRYYERFVEAGADLVNIHCEVVEDLRGALKKVAKAGVRTGVTLKPNTPVRAIEGALDLVDMVLVMSVEPGFGGQSFMANMLSKVRELARLRQSKGHRFLIQVDGGINTKTVGLAVAAGTNVLVAGTAVFGSGPIERNIDSLVEAGLEMNA